MNYLIKQIDDFINKQVKFRSRSEAAKYGIKGLPSEQPKFPKVPKQPKMPRQVGTISPRSYRPRQTEAKLPGIAGEVARQMTPLGPGYRSPEDIAQDISEARRLAHRITGIKRPGLK